MNILVIGSGGREHALAWKLAQSPKAAQGLRGPWQWRHGARCAPGRMCPSPTCQALADFAQANKVALTVVGPEAPLAAGVVDEFRARGLRIFGPTQRAAQLESSKAFAKDFMKRHGIPTAFYETFTDTDAAHAFIDKPGRAHRHQGRWPGGGQGRGRGHDAGRGPPGGGLDAGGQQARRDSTTQAARAW